MDIAVKQRILGGVILIAGAVLFLPVLLQGAGVKALQPPTAPVAPKTPTTAELAPSLQKDAAKIDQDIADSHGEPTFYPVQPSQAPAPVISNETPEQFKLVTPAGVAEAKPVERKVEESRSADAKLADEKVASEKAASEKARAEKLQAEQQKAEKLKAQQAHADAEAKAKADKLAAAQKAEEKKAEAKKAEDKKLAEAKAAAARPQDKVAAKSADPDPALPQAWVVQVAVLSSKDKAQALETRLRAKGFRASVTGSGDKWRVVTGPELDKSVAESVRGRLDAAGFSGGWVQAYRP